MSRRSSGKRLVYRKDRKLWYIRWYENGKKHERSTGTDDKRKAEEKLASLIIETLSTQPMKGRSKPEERLISDTLILYMEQHAPHTKSPQTIAYSSDRLLEFFQNDTVADITATRCREYAKWRESGGGGRPSVKISSIKRELDVLQSAINFDYKNSTLTEVRPVWKPKTPKSKERWLTHDEAESLFKAAASSPEHLQLFIALALFTGARKTAILNLKWNQVDLLGGYINYNVLGEAETNKKRALIPIADKLMPYLVHARNRGTGDGYVIHINQKPLKDIKKSFQHACKKAGLSDVTPHTLRHTCATWLAQAGVPFPKIAQYIGHKNSRTTEAIYAHHAPDYLREVKDVFANNKKGSEDYNVTTNVTKDNFEKLN